MGRRPKAFKIKQEEKGPIKSKDWLQTPKGMRDILPGDYLYWQNIYSKAEEIAFFYGFRPIKTPHIEKENLFIASVGETSDIVEKQMYYLKTKDSDKLVLRPEGTAPVMRSYLEHGMHSMPQPIMLWYKGSFFRYESPQRGRFRELEQFGLEILGEDDAFADALIIITLCLILKELGIVNHIIHLNSLGERECGFIYKKELVAFFKRKANYLCKNCERRLKTNPLRILDCKEEMCREINKDAPQMINYLCEECKEHFRNLLETLDSAKISYIIDHRLVRGLDYYSRTVFEIFIEKTEEDYLTNEDGLAQDEDSVPAMANLAIGGGGRYDYLGSALSNKNVPAVGGSLGIDRIVEILKNNNIKIKSPGQARVFLVQLGLVAKRKSLILMEDFRKARVLVAQSLMKDNIKNQLKIASKLNIPFALIMGQKEALDDTIIIRDMASGSQEIISFSEAVSYIKGKIKL